MIEQNIFIINYNTLYEILDEIKENLSFKIIKYQNDEDFIKHNNLNTKNSLIILNSNQEILLHNNLCKKNFLNLKDLPLGINKFINNAVKGKKLEFKGNPGSKRNYVYVGDAAKTIKKCLDKKIYGIFYIGGEIQTFKKMMKKINFKLGKNKNVIFKKSNEPISNQIILNDKIIKPTSFSKSLNLIR